MWWVILIGKHACWRISVVGSVLWLDLYTWELNYPLTIAILSLSDATKKEKTYAHTHKKEEKTKKKTHYE